MKTRYSLKAITACIFSLFLTQANAQFSIDTTMTVNDLVEELFSSGILVEVSNVTFNGIPGDDINPQILRFSNGAAEGIDMDQGLAMYTGFAERLFTDNFGGFLPIVVSDPDISQMVNGVGVNDCAVLEFDVLVNADQLAFGYMFGSTEYNAFTCSVFNDAFGLFLSGPDISGEYSNNAINIATIPNSDVNVAINTVNGGVPTGGGQALTCEAANPNWVEDSQYFVDNINGQVSSIDLNGFTVPFEALYDVVNGETYHLKFAICDAIDQVLDSGVLFEAGSLEGRLVSDIDKYEIKDLNIYPNPTTDGLMVDLDNNISGTSEFKIHDVQGRYLKSIVLNTQGNTLSIDVSELDRGMYFISQFDGNQLVARSKFMKD